MSPRAKEHGTPEGYEAGCRDHHKCPAAPIHGLSCETAYFRFISEERRYMEARRRDPRAAAIARRLGLRPVPTPAPTVDAEPSIREETAAGVSVAGPPTTATAPAAPKPAQPLAERANDAEPQEDAGAPAIETEAPTAPSEPAAEAEAMAHPTTPTPQETTMTKPTTPGAHADFLRLHGEGLSDRAIAKEIGVSQGTISRWRRDAGLAPNGRRFGAPATPTSPPEPTTGNDYTDLLDPVRDRINRDDTFEAAIQAAVAAAPTLTPRPDALAADLDSLPAPRPEWAEVAISEDVENARDLAVLLEGELARTETALELVLHKWHEERVRRQAVEADAERTFQQLRSDLTTANGYILALEDDLAGIKRLQAESREAAARRVAELRAALDRRPAPLWKRVLGK